jgi:hypothetical protein
VSPVNCRRYEGYVAVRNALAAEPVEGVATSVLADLAEGPLLSRGLHEPSEVRDRVPVALVGLVDRGHLSSFAAHRLWARLRACGPALDWPPTWQGPE